VATAEPKTLAIIIMVSPLVAPAFTIAKPLHQADQLVNHRA
jgi:hypothetical protein